NRHEHICESLELFAKEVMPEFKQRHERQERQKMERLAPAIEAALARRPPARNASEEYVVVAAAAPQPPISRGPGEVTTDHQWADCWHEALSRELDGAVSPAIGPTAAFRQPAFGPPTSEVML